MLPGKKSLFKPNLRISPALNSKVQVDEVSIELPPAHPKQQELIHSFEARLDPAKPGLGPIYDSTYLNFDKLPKAFPELRFIVGACGTKFGKTYGCVIKLLEVAWENRDPVTDVPMKQPGLYWWVAPTYKQAMNAYRLMLRMIPKQLREEYKADLRIVLKTPDGEEHANIEFKSADNPDNLRGFAVHFFIFDEAARGVSYESFLSVLTTVTQTMGKGIFISTPNGRNWFYDVYKRGEKNRLAPGDEDPWPEWKSIRMPSWTNPHVPIKSIETWRRNLPRQVFEQEVAARFLQNSAGVFNNIDSCFKPYRFNADGSVMWEPPVKGRRYVMGVDLAKKHDYTVIMVFDVQTHRLVYFYRFNKIEWDINKHRIISTAKHYNNALICMDGTGVGDPICTDVANAGCRVKAYTISQKSKGPLIDKARVNVEFGKVSFPDFNPLVCELRDFEYEVTTAGNTKYSAPSGQHDDCVIAFALAVWILDATPFVYQHRQVRV